MEIWIIGGLLVTLMVLISTRIKKTAAKAYEPETIETDEFSVRKPEGFLHPIREKMEFPFEIYSKLFGGDRETRNIWRARARLRISEGRKLDEIYRAASKDEKFTSKDISKTEDGREGVSRSEKEDDEIKYAVLRRVIESIRTGKTYELRVTMIAKHEGEYAERGAEILASLDIK